MISAKLQACCLNFNAALKTIFGPEHGLDRELGVALQFADAREVQFVDQFAMDAALDFFELILAAGLGTPQALIDGPHGDCFPES